LSTFGAVLTQIPLLDSERRKTVLSFDHHQHTVAQQPKNYDHSCSIMVSCREVNQKERCTTCSKEILLGSRFHCSTCTTFDQCRECVQDPNTPRHPHPLMSIPEGAGGGRPRTVEENDDDLTEQQPQQGEDGEQRIERNRNIRLHMLLLSHAAVCTSPRCPSDQCEKMKVFFEHWDQCQFKGRRGRGGGCRVCRRIRTLLEIHTSCVTTGIPPVLFPPVWLFGSVDVCEGGRQR